MSWNHRVLAYTYKDEVYFRIHEIYYNNDGIPTACTEKATCVIGESLESIKWNLTKMLECLEKPVLWGDERFPTEYKADTNHE